MGAHLSEPVTEKETSKADNKMLSVASSSMQGWRITMEDAHSHILDYGGDETAAFLAVFDGHGGSKVAQFASVHLAKQLLDTTAYKEGNIKQAIRDALLQVDEKLLKDDATAVENCGTTAVLILVKGNQLYCGNVGDSRAVASCLGDVVELSHDHKPSNPKEAERIVAGGGFVEFNRVNGNLALSRALGDFAFKRAPDKPPDGQIVSAVPDVIDINITPDLEFAVLACDGIWDVLKNDEVVDFVRSRIAQKMDPSQICEELLTRCLAPDCRLGSIGCDNMTAVIACFLHDSSYDELAKKCQRPKKTPVDEGNTSEVPDQDPVTDSGNSSETVDAGSSYGAKSGEGTTSCNTESLPAQVDNVNTEAIPGDGVIDKPSSSGENGLIATETNKSCTDQ